MSEPAALDLAAIREWCAQEMDDYTTSTRRAVRRASCEYVDGLPTHSIRSQLLALVDELERCRAERDALCVALERIRDYSYLAGEGLPRAIALEALGGVTQ